MSLTSSHAKGWLVPSKQSIIVMSLKGRLLVVDIAERRHAIVNALRGSDVYSFRFTTQDIS